MAAPALIAGAQRIIDGQGDRLQPQTLDRARSLRRRRQVPIDNNWIENRIRPIATGRKNWLFAGSLRAGKRAAAIMRLIQSAKLNDHDSFLYLKDVLSRLPTQPNSRIGELLPTMRGTTACLDASG